jgi:hypothetical protein
MGADNANGDVLYFPEGTILEKADRAHRHAAHVYAHAKPENKAAALKALREAAILYVAAAANSAGQVQ